MFLGIGYTIWGLLCLLVAGIYLVYFPGRRSRAQERPRWRYIILRWFHSLVWVLLGAACFMWGGLLPGAATAARRIASLSLLIYLIYILIFVTDRRAKERATR